MNQDIDEKERRKFMYTLVSKVMNELNPEDKLIVAPIYEDFCFKVEDFIMSYYNKTWSCKHKNVNSWSYWNGNEWVLEDN